MDLSSLCTVVPDLGYLVRRQIHGRALFGVGGDELRRGIALRSFVILQYVVDGVVYQTASRNEQFVIGKNIDIWARCQQLKLYIPVKRSEVPVTLVEPPFQNSCGDFAFVTDEAVEYITTEA